MKEERSYYPVQWSPARSLAAVVLWLAVPSIWFVSYSLSVFVLCTVMQLSRVSGSEVQSFTYRHHLFHLPQIKTQLQSRSGAPIAVGHQHNVAGFCDAFYKIYSRHGFRGLWRGATGSMMRVTVGSSVQLPTFSKVKCLMDQYQVRGEISHFRRHHHHADRTCHLSPFADDFHLFPFSGRSYPAILYLRPLCQPQWVELQSALR